MSRTIVAVPGTGQVTAGMSALRHDRLDSALPGQVDRASRPYENVCIRAVSSA